MSEAGVHRPLPGLYDAVLAPFALSPRDRCIARVLVRCVRLPGVVALLGRWHRARAGKK